MRRKIYQNGIDVFEEKDDVRLGELNVNVAVEGVNGLDVLIRIVEQRDIDTEQLFVISLLRDNLEQREGRIFCSASDGTLRYRAPSYGSKTRRSVRMRLTNVFSTA